MNIQDKRRFQQSLAELLAFRLCYTLPKTELESISTMIAGIRNYFG